MINILVRGCPGTGKTYLSRAAAYYICEQNLDIKDAFEQDCISSQAEIEAFVNSDRCEYIQVHPSMEFDDIVYGFDIKANGSMSIAYAEKRIMQLCNNAKGKNRLYCIILDDINRANAGRLLGNILYAMEYRNQEIQLADGSEMTIPDNVVLIFTENTLDPSNGLDLAIRRRMTFLKVLMSDRTVIRKWYRGFLSPSALKLILDVYDRIEDFIRSYISPEQNIKPDQFVLSDIDIITLSLKLKVNNILKHSGNRCWAITHHAVFKGLICKIKLHNTGKAQSQLPLCGLSNFVLNH